MSTPRELPTVDALRVRVTSPDADGAGDVFLLELRFAEPTEPVDDGVRLGLLADLLDLSAHDCVVRIGREYRFGVSAASTSEVDVALGAEAGRDHVALTQSVGDTFRAIIAATGADRPAPLDHAAALRSAVGRVVGTLGDTGGADLTVSTEEHLDDEWVFRLVAPGRDGRVVRIGFVDGHPGATHIRRVHAEEVADSIGTE